MNDQKNQNLSSSNFFNHRTYITHTNKPTGKYYAVEDMLTTKPEEKFGTITLQEHYDRIAVEGQEYDPYTTMFAKAPE